MLELTAADIVERMKKFLCIFAWNIQNPDFVTAECVDQILQVARSALAEVPVAHSDSPQAPSDPAAASTADSSAPKLPLKRCIDILREQLGIEAVAMNVVVEEALNVLSDDALTAHCNSQKSLLLKAQYLVYEGIGYQGD